jgi:hypothetical protein
LFYYNDLRYGDINKALDVNMLARLGMVIQALLATSIFYLGYTIYSFTSAVTTVVDTYPQLMNDINETSEKLEIEQWLQVAKTFEEITPQALTLVAELKNTIDDVNQTVASVDQKIPLVLEEVKVIRSETMPAVIEVVDTVSNKTIPQTLVELENYRKDVIPVVLLESKAYRQNTIPAVLNESEQLRKDVPIVVAKVDEIVEKSEQLTQQATQGAVKGVILSPINLIRDAGTELKSKVNE